MKILIISTVLFVAVAASPHLSQLFNFEREVGKAVGEAANISGTVVGGGITSVANLTGAAINATVNATETALGGVVAGASNVGSSLLKIASGLFQFFV